MKVLMFGWEFPPHITGGLGTACYGLTKSLTKQGVEVIFVVPKLFGEEDQSFMRIVGAEDIPINITDKSVKEIFEKITYVEVSSSLVPYLSPEEYKKFLEEYKLKSVEKTENIFSTKFNFSGEYGPNIFEEVARYALIAGVLAQQNDFDIIHAHDWLTYPAGIAAKKISGKKLVVHVHATEFDRSGENINHEVYNIEKQGMEEADQVITVSNYTRNIVINKYGISPEKVFTVHNGVEPIANIEHFKVTKKLPYKIVTFLGRITFQKGPDYFVEAAYKVLQKSEDVHFVMAGSGDMLNRIVKRVAELRMGDKFHFTGFLKGNDVYRMYAMSDVYVMPSVSEPFGIAPLEAMQTDVPVIISKQSGVAEVLHHAIKIDFWDVDAMSDSIYALLHYDGIRRLFKKYGKQEVINLKWDNAAFLVKTLYQKLLGTK
jgi:glycogen(starch) synthase